MVWIQDFGHFGHKENQNHSNLLRPTFWFQQRKQVIGCCAETTEGTRGTISSKIIQYVQKV